jgi:hypothetical protein
MASLSTALSQEGFACVDTFLARDELQSLQAAALSLEDDSSGARARRGSVFAHRNLLNTSLVKTALSFDCVQALARAIAVECIAVRAILFDKTGDANWTVPWHQDRSIALRERRDVDGFGPWSHKAGVVHVQPPLELLRQMFTLRFSLDACPLDNGPLRVIAGTHKTLLSPGEIDHHVATQPQVACTTDAGGVVLMRPLLLHASSPARTATHRRVLHIEFAPPVLPGKLQWALA